MKYLKLLLMPAILLLPVPGLAGFPGTGGQPKSSVEERVKVAIVGFQGTEEERRLQAAVELLRLGKQAEPAVPQLIATLRGSEDNLAVIILALGQIGEPAVKPLVALLREAPDPKRFGPLTALTSL